MKLRIATILAAIWVHSGCAFFGVERVECLTEDHCPENTQPGDGDGDPTGGAFGDGDGDGDTGGASPSGGGSGGQASGGSGGADTGGSGGEGTGGEGTGGEGTGGQGTGGQGTGGSGGSEIDQLERDLKINEIHPSYVEIYLTDSEAQYVLDGFIIVVDGNYALPFRCELDGAELNADDRFLSVQVASLGDSCFGGATNCVTGCQFTIAPGSHIQLMKDIMGSHEEVNDMSHTDSTLGAGNSYRADTDGNENTFSVGARSPGQPNNQ